MGKKESTDYPHWWMTHTQKQKKIMLKSSRTHKFEVIRLSSSWIPVVHADY